MPPSLTRQFREALLDTDRKRAVSLVQAAVGEGVSAEEVLFEVVVPEVHRTLAALGEDGNLSLAQHYLTSQIAADAAEWLVPRFSTRLGPAGCVVIGTSWGDFHGLGKTIVSGCLAAHNLRVCDLGLNVPAERFVAQAEAEAADVIGISSMMVHTAIGETGCRQVRRLLRERGLDGRIKVIVGGAPYRHDPALWRAVDADAWAPDGLTAVDAIKQLLKQEGK